MGVDVISRSCSECSISFNCSCSCGGKMNVVDYSLLIIDEEKTTKRAEVQCDLCGKYEYYYD